MPKLNNKQYVFPATEHPINSEIIGSGICDFCGEHVRQLESYRGRGIANLCYCQKCAPGRDADKGLVPTPTKKAKTKMNKEFNYYFNNHIDKNHVFLELADRIISLINSNKDFEVTLQVKKISSKDIYLSTR